MANTPTREHREATQPPPESAEPALVVIKTECWCERCKSSVCWLGTRMSICPSCGNKRCPRAEWHGFVCSGSNETGQVGVPSPVATDTQAQPATPAPAGDAEVGHERALRLSRMIEHQSRELARYAAECEARQQQAERDVVERWKGANGYNDMLQAYGAAIDERDRYRDKKRELEQREVSLRDDIAELSRKLEAAERRAMDYSRELERMRIGRRASLDIMAEEFPTLGQEWRSCLAFVFGALGASEEHERLIAAYPAPPDQTPPAKPFIDPEDESIVDELMAKRAAGLAETKMLTRDDVKAIIAEVAERANGQDDWDELALLKLAKAAKEESGGG